MSSTKVTWAIKGETNKYTTLVPDGEFYADWISEFTQGGVKSSEIVVVSTEVA